jgi:putative ABC transport system ATP-binding protein
MVFRLLHPNPTEPTPNGAATLVAPLPINQAPNHLSTQAPTPIIHLHQITKRFRVGDGEVEILKGITLTIGRGEFVAIVGPSGNGKSTLLNMISGIDHPSSGQVIVTGQPIHTLSENQLAGWRSEHLGIIFQFFQLLPALSLLKNVMLPMDFAPTVPRLKRKERALHLLDMVGLADQAEKLPSMVSGGQQQRAAIARALANDPPLIVADEPTGNLDTKTAEDVFQLFSNLVNQGKTLVMVTHSHELAARTQRVIEIRNGVIAHEHINP